MVENAAPAVTNTYTWDGQLTVSAVTDPVGTITSKVDFLGRSVESIDVWGTKSVVNTFDDFGRATKVTVTSGGIVFAISWLAHGGAVCENPWEEKQGAIPATGSYMGCNWTSGGEGRRALRDLERTRRSPLLLLRCFSSL